MVLKWMFGIILAGVVYALWQYANSSFAPARMPALDQEEWWGPKETIGKTDKTLKPFKIEFKEDMIKDLRYRLNSHQPFTPPLEGIDFQYGMNTNQLEEIVKYWAKDYPFSEREKFFNKYPQFKTNIQGLDIHFIRVKPETKPGVTVVPLILLHGWPGSVREFYEAIPLLTQKRPGYDFVFEVVIPSLPGYGFSDGTVRPGLGATQMAVIMRNLMQRLGHKKYYIQGGDWGAAIGSSMSTLYPKEVLGYHTNMAFTMNPCALIKTLIGSFLPSLYVDSKLEDRMYPLSKFFSHVMEEFGYMHLQATKPDTAGVAINDSPAGLASYVLEKFAIWTIRGSKSLPSHLSKEGLIDNLMVYWITNSMTTSMRLYAETASKKHMALNMDSIPTNVPFWALQAKHELFYQPPSILKTKFKNLLNTTVLETGGHFIAFELPEVLTQDVFTAVKEFRSWHDQQKKEKTDL